MNENQRCSPAERGWARGSRGGCARRRVCVCVSLFVCECVSVCKVWGEGFGGRGGGDWGWGGVALLEDYHSRQTDFPYEKDPYNYFLR